MANDTPPLPDCAWFESDLPDDAEYDEHDEPTLPSGRALANQLHEILHAAGLEVGEAEPHEDHAWIVEARRGRASVECLVQGQGDYLLYTVSRGLFAGNQRRELQGDVLDVLRAGLTPERGFKNILWGTRDALANAGKCNRVGSLFRRKG
jgi:hypothetical protein